MKRLFLALVALVAAALWYFEVIGAAWAVFLVIATLMLPTIWRNLGQWAASWVALVAGAITYLAYENTVYAFVAVSSVAILMWIVAKTIKAIAKKGRAKP